jgi:hypothetical protein
MIINSTNIKIMSETHNEYGPFCIFEHDEFDAMLNDPYDKIQKYALITEIAIYGHKKKLID